MKRNLTVTVEEHVIDRIDHIAYALNVTRGTVIHGIFDMALDRSINVCEGWTFENLTVVTVRVKEWYKQELERKKALNLNNNKKLVGHRVSRNS
jgi:hypothetical protein